MIVSKIESIFNVCTLSSFEFGFPFILEIGKRHVMYYDFLRVFKRFRSYEFLRIVFSCPSSQVPLALPSLDELVKESLAAMMKEGKTNVENI